MPTTVFEFTGLLGSGLTVSTNPDPNTLATTNPYGASPAHTQLVSAAWTSQNRRAFFPDPLRDYLYNSPIALSFVPSGGNATTYSVTLWKWDGTTWVKPANTPTQSYAGAILTYIENPGRNPWFMQINTLSTGTLTVRFDQAAATAL
jgi:hypothetical protein